MSDSLDPYYKWLGIPPDEQPPHHYRLLGISLFEEDRDVIQMAADRQMMLLKSLRTGKNARAAEQILNEISAARICLLDNKNKAAYDAELKTDSQLDQPLAEDADADRPAEVTTKSPVSAGASERDADEVSKTRSVVPPRPGQTAETDQPSPPESPSTEPDVVATDVSVGAKTPSRVATRDKRRRRKATPLWLHPAALGSVALIVAGVGIFAMQRSKPTALPSGAELVADDSEDPISDVTSRGHQQDVTHHQQDPSAARPRSATRPAKDDDGFPAAGQLVGQQGSTPSGPDSPQPSAEAQRKATIEQMDTDSDAILTLAEFAEFFRQRFNYLDKNGDGVLDPKEWEQAGRKNVDANQDGKVDPAEYVAFHKQNFTNLDQNKDERLTIDEKKPDAPATPENLTPVIEPPHQVARRLPVPDDSSLRQARSQITRFYKDPISQAQTPEQKLELASSILAQLGQTSDIAERFALFQLAGSLAAKAGDAQLAMDTVAKMSEVFEVDDLEEQVSLLTQLLPNVTQRDHLAHLAQRSAILADEAIRRDQYAAADRLISIAKQAARSAQEIEFLRQLIDRGKDIKAIRSAFHRAQWALATLDEDPQDADANQVVGEFLCFVKQQWQRGLPLLAQGTDPTLRELAAREIAATAGNVDALRLGHGWWEVAQKERGPGRKGLELRAAYWYRQALPDLPDEAKAQVATRLQEIELQYPAPKPLAPLPVKEPADQDKPADAVHPVLKYALKPHPGNAMEFGGHYYKVFRGRVTWKEAQRRCAASGGYLVCLGSDQEAKFVKNLVSQSRRNPKRSQLEKDRLWIGGIKGPNGVWRWISGEPSKYVKWAPSQPDNGLGNEYFLQINEDGKWHDAPFDAASNEGFICEWER